MIRLLLRGGWFWELLLWLLPAAAAACKQDPIRTVAVPSQCWFHLRDLP
jgi:hypothetical protein